MTDELLAFIKECIRLDDMHSFYIKTVWKKKRIEIVKRDHFECQACKRKGKIKIVKLKARKISERAYVHHKKHLKDYPELALENDNLETLCFECHELEHPEERNLPMKPKEGFTNEERW